MATFEVAAAQYCAWLLVLTNKSRRKKDSVHAFFREIQFVHIIIRFGGMNCISNCQPFFCNHWFYWLFKMVDEFFLPEMGIFSWNTLDYQWPKKEKGRSVNSTPPRAYEVNGQSRSHGKERTGLRISVSDMMPMMSRLVGLFKVFMLNRFDTLHSKIVPLF